MINLEERIYTPDQGRGRPFGIWQDMVAEALRSRELAWRLFVRDFSARYKQSALGVLWALLIPIIGSATFIFLNSTGVLNVGDVGVPYAVYALLSLTLWQVFSNGLIVCSNAIVAGGNMIVKINFPKETLVVAAMGQVLFELFVRLVLVVVVMIATQTPFQWTTLLFPLVLLPLLLFTVGLGFLLSLLNVIFRDVANVVTLAATFLMFLTPVVYPAPESGLLATVMALNPLSGLIAAPRDLLLRGYLGDPAGFAWSAILSVILFFVAWRVFHLVEYKMAEAV